MQPQRFEIILPDDWHLHFRDGAALEAVVLDTALQFGRALVMPNLKPPVTTVAQAMAYRDRIRSALVRASAQAGLDQPPAFDPQMTLYLTDATDPQEVVRAAQTEGVLAFKLYPAGATTNSDSGVTSLTKVSRVLAEMERQGVVLCIHGEETAAEIDVFDREARFIEDKLIPLLKDFPGLRVVFEHITTQEAADFVQAGSVGQIAATITPQHLLFNRNQLFQGGLRPHYYCLPVLKRAKHQAALVAAATSGDPRFFLGTDSAPHARHTKEADCGCAGCYSAPTAMAFYAEVFAAEEALDRLEGFASCHGPDFYRLPRNTARGVLTAETTVVPQELAFGTETIVPLAAGRTLPYRFERLG